MGKQWLEIDGASGNVRGWARSSSDTLPTGGDAILIVEASDEKIGQYEALRSALAADGRAALVQYSEGMLSAPPDDRLLVDVVVDKTTGIVGVDAVNIEVTALDADGNVRQDFNQIVYYPFPDGRLFAFQFVNGIAARAITFTKSGHYTLQSNAQIAMVHPVELTVAE